MGILAISRTTTANNGLRYNAKTAFDYELGAHKVNTTATGKVGLMYVSDYYYALAPNYWALPGKDNVTDGNDYRLAKAYNWLYVGSVDWMISPTKDMNEYALLIRYGSGSYTGLVEWGRVAPQEGSYDLGFIRPAFYLASSAKLVGGTGTASDPYRIN